MRGGLTGQARAWSEKFCKVCYHQGAPPGVFESHTRAGCRRVPFPEQKAFLRSVMEAGEDDSQQQDDALNEEYYEGSTWDVSAQYYDERNKSADSYPLS